MFYVLVSEGPKDDDVQLNGCFDSLAEAQGSISSDDYDGPLTFTILRLQRDGSLKPVSVGHLPEATELNWKKI